MKLLYLLRKDRKKGNSYLLRLRVTLEGRSYFSTDEYIPLRNWDQESQLATGRGFAALNDRLRDIKDNAHKIHSEAMRKGLRPTSKDITHELRGGAQSSKQIRLADAVRSLASYKWNFGNIVESTFQRYQNLANQLEEGQVNFVAEEMIKADRIKVYSYLRSINATNTANKKYGMISSSLDFLVDETEEISKNVLKGLPRKDEKIEIIYLTAEELERLRSLDLTSKSLERTRDIFLFQCYTACEYSRVQSLTVDYISIGFRGQKWLLSSRKKTDEPGNVVLLKPALELIEKYKHDECREKGHLFPRKSNTGMNDCLKVLSDLAGIDKALTTHKARHTFAITVCMNNPHYPISPASTAKMMGITQKTLMEHYGKIIDQRTGNEMMKLSEAMDRVDDDSLDVAM